MAAVAMGAVAGMVAAMTRRALILDEFQLAELASLLADAVRAGVQLSRTGEALVRYVGQEASGGARSTEVVDLSPDPPQAVSEQLLSRRECAERLHVSLSTVDRLPIPRVRVRRRVLFQRSDIEEYVNHANR